MYNDIFKGDFNLENLPVKPSGPGNIFMGNLLLAISSCSFIDTEFSGLSIFSWVNFHSLCASMSSPVSFFFLFLLWPHCMVCGILAPCKCKWKSLSHVRLFATHGLHSPWNSPEYWRILEWIARILEWIARILEWIAFPFSQGSSQPRDWTQVSRIAGGFIISWAMREAQKYWSG